MAALERPPERRTPFCRLNVTKRNAAGTMRRVFRRIVEEVEQHLFHQDHVEIEQWQTILDIAAFLMKKASRIARFEKAVEAHCAALEVLTQENVPLAWAVTMNNFGNALLRIGERQGGTTWLFRKALEELTREPAPLQWARVQVNLGTALERLGEREDDKPRLEEAIAFFREALKEFTRERAPDQWSRADLGTALQAFGKADSGSVWLEEAVGAYREALKEMDPAREPLKWAGLQNNLDQMFA